MTSCRHEISGRSELARRACRGTPLTRSGMWHVIDQALDSGVPLGPVTLRQPPGERGWTFKFRLASSQPLVYVKLQIIGSHVVLRSFHYSEDDHHA